MAPFLSSRKDEQSPEKTKNINADVMVTAKVFNRVEVKGNQTKTVCETEYIFEVVLLQP